MLATGELGETWPYEGLTRHWEVGGTTPNEGKTRKPTQTRTLQRPMPSDNRKYGQYCRTDTPVARGQDSTSAEMQTISRRRQSVNVKEPARSKDAWLKKLRWHQVNGKNNNTGESQEKDNK